uniref:Amyloid beta (A4) protein n=1 Tax=Paracentrotus lividus TaxID=7656 RepID=C0JV68_PARLI|nr:amyloid beta (A4) precursor protein [Paracentrotus lividus]
MENFIKMASKTAIYTVLLFAILSVASAGYVEALAAGAFDPSSSRVELRVALRDGYYSKYADIISGQWLTDMSAEYTSDTKEILNYCRKKYPNPEINNIVDSSQPTLIEQWCPVNGEECTSSATVTYYRCLAGPFESDALMVYNVCKFYHKHDEQMCREPEYWKGVAEEDCRGKKMGINSTGMLLPCGTDKFKGVEYTCCPPPTYRPMTAEETEVEEEEEEAEAEAAAGEEMGHVEEPVKAPAPERDNVVSKPQITSNILDDPYFSENGLTGSQEKKEYANAKSRLSTKEKSKMARVMQQWQEAQEHYETLKVKNPEAAEKMRKEMTERFEETIGNMETENTEETEELREAHQVHIAVSLREKINASYESYRITVDVPKPKSKKILHALRRYLHAIQKARQHYITHYKHLRKTDPLKADQHKRFTLHKLKTLDLEVAQSVDLLQNLPELYTELKPKVDALLDSTHDSPEDAALIRATEEEEMSEATEAPPAERIELEPVAEIMEPDVEEETEEEVEVEEEVPEEETETPAISKSSETKPSTQVKPSPVQTKPSTIQTKPRTSTATQTDPEPPTPSRDADFEQETEIQVPAENVQIVAVKPIESYLDEELTAPIETEDVKPQTLIIAQKPKAKVEKSAAAARMEKQRLVNRQDVNSIDNSVTKKRMQLRSEPMMAFGLACGVLAVATILVIAVLIVRRKTRRTPVNSGFTEIDPNLTVEQRHIVAMQQNGYENPTYKYFDMQ